MVTHGDELIEAMRAQVHAEVRNGMRCATCRHFDRRQNTLGRCTNQDTCVEVTRASFGCICHEEKA